MLGAARAGALVRSTAEAAQDAGLDRLDGYRPRAVVLLNRSGVGATAASVLSALLGEVCPVPVVFAETAPVWLGALDVVIAHADDPNDPIMAESIALAARRGAQVVVTAPENGPVAAAAAGRAMLLPDRVEVPPGLGFSRAFTAGLVTLLALGLLVGDHGERLELVADELDREAERNHPQHESFVNPAKSLALRFADRQPLLWGLDPVATAVAGHGALAMARFAGVVADVQNYQHAVRHSALLRRAQSATSEHNIFADPDELTGAPPRVVLVAIREDQFTVAARQAATASLPGADLVAPADEVRSGDIARAAVLALRFDMAAIYLGFAAGTIGGPGLFAPSAY
ncbi:hypothetical protein D5S17_05890 [Pseudonocardiaceae bacterium YIM PH 21723]|nr:hypothetical protein D5S17_05890 [Pseudonocardiaceae bacterium YIM PH 21723]